MQFYATLILLSQTLLAGTVFASQKNIPEKNLLTIVCEEASFDSINPILKGGKVLILQQTTTAKGNGNYIYKKGQNDILKDLDFTLFQFVDEINGSEAIQDEIIRMLKKSKESNDPITRIFDGRAKISLGTTIFKYNDGPDIKLYISGTNKDQAHIEDNSLEFGTKRYICRKDPIYIEAPK